MWTFCLSATKFLLCSEMATGCTIFGCYLGSSRGLFDSNVFTRTISCILTKADFSLQPSHKDLKMWLTSWVWKTLKKIHTMCQMQQQISTSREKNKKEDNNNNKRCFCSKFLWNNDDAVPKDVRFQREKIKRKMHLKSKHWVFPIVLHKDDESGGNLTSLNYNLESNKLWLLRCTTNWEWSGKKSSYSTFLSEIPDSYATLSI